MVTCAPAAAGTARAATAATAATARGRMYGNGKGPPSECRNGRLKAPAARLPSGGRREQRRRPADAEGAVLEDRAERENRAWPPALGAAAWPGDGGRAPARDDPVLAEV